MNYKFPSSLWMIRILQRHYAPYKYVKYGLSLVNLCKFGFIKSEQKIFLWSWKISNFPVREKMAKMEKNIGVTALLERYCWAPEVLNGWETSYKKADIFHTCFYLGLSSSFYFPKWREIKHATRAFTLPKNNYGLWKLFKLR